jgi:hypothetical protein
LQGIKGMVTMTAKRRFAYADKSIDAGQKFEARSEQDAHVLEVAGFASREGPAPDQEEAKRQAKQRYRRRDMRSEH